MLLLSKLYTFLYFFYSFFGYNFIDRLIKNKTIDYAKLNVNAYAFIGKRLVMLSHLFFLYCAYYLENPNENRYINVIILQITINGGYYINWGIIEISTTFMHLFWGFPVLLYDYNNINYNLYNCKLNYENYFLLIFLLFYSQIYNHIYTPRIKFIDANE